MGTNDNYQIHEDVKVKAIKSPLYNYVFMKDTGLHMRWGKTPQDDPDMSVFGPEILDIEVSTICNGINGKPCKFCYKGNTGKGENMSFETFKTIFDKMPRTLTQIAFGIGDIKGNPDLFKMFDYCRNNGHNFVVPNVTINGWGLTEELAKKFASVCGAVAVSRYEPKDVCYNAVNMLTDAGLEQVNIHMLLSEETYDKCFEIVDDMKSDQRLAKMKAVVFLGLKPKGRGVGFHRITSLEKFKALIDYAFEKKVSIGFDSCSSSSFLKAVKDHPNYDQYQLCAEPCESNLFSSYINSSAKYFHCSFTEGSDGFEGIDMLQVTDFLKEVWFSDEAKMFREKLLNNICEETGCRMCPIYNLRMERDNQKIIETI
jgi:hypothetical protein